ncbi:helix-turn-helix domain-containing protein [Staphylococcus xylosus]|uniref:helix-turn-helix domain-containing protein n=1 Tax=Staphylococcus xylosus TaxID=1288 RepID=UPI0015F90780|nr:XRE family transcriptional regulator [Staphylococcus xylosus]
MIFSKRMKLSREKQGITLAELGKRIGKTEATVQRYESGNIKNLKNETIESIANALNTNPAYLMGWLESDSIKKVKNTTYQDIQENLNDVQESNSPLINDFIEEVIKEQNKKSTSIPETTRMQLQLSHNRQNKVLKFATNQLQQQENSNVTSLDEYKNREKVPFPAYGSTGAGIGEELYDDILSEEVYFYEDEIPDTADFCIFVNGDSMEPALRQGTYCFIQNIQQIKDGLVALIIYDGTVLIKKIALDENEVRLVSLNPKYEDIIVKDHQQFKLVGKVVQ